MRTLCRLLRIVLLLATATPSYAAVQVIAAGGQGGETFVEPPSGAHVRIAAVVVHAGSWVDSLQLLYQMADGQRMLSSRRGGSAGVAHVFTLEPDERIVAISGRYGHSDATVQAIAAGCDAVLMCAPKPDEQWAALEAVVHAAEEGRIPHKRIEDAFARGRRVKERFLAAPHTAVLTGAALKRVLGSDEHQAVAADMARYV